MRGVLLDLDTITTGDLDLGPLHAALPDLRLYGTSAPETIPDRVVDAEVVITNKAPLPRSTLEGARALRLVCVTATGTDHVDLDAARSRGIVLSNVVGYATDSVAQHVFGLMLALTTRLFEYRHTVLSGAWSRSPHFTALTAPIHELRSRVLGIVGYGELGRAVARLGEAYGMRIRVAERAGQPPRTGRIPLEDLLAEADVLSLHCPLTSQTRGLIGPRELARMKPGALLINTARGGVVDEPALAAALRSGHLGGAGIDVLSREPPPPDHPLLAADLPNLIVTPHIAWASREARQRLVTEIAANLHAFQAGHPRNRVV
ncbi:MAG: D-2-hydroxyacid dehydrogenase [Gammaproteobacteria bacterium]